MISNVTMILVQRGGNLTVSNLILLFLIVLLVVYILYLQYQLRKKNLHLDSLYQEFSNFKEPQEHKDHTRTIKPEMVERDKIKPDPLADLKKFLADEIENSIIYIHYTNSQSIADKIIKEGFKFSESFHKTAEQISRDLKDLDYKHQIRKYFGNYIVILAIRKDVFSFYEKELNLFDVKSLSIEHMVSHKLFDDETGDEIYLLPNNFVKGYFDFQSGDFTGNPKFDPGLDVKLPEKNSPGRKS